MQQRNAPDSSYVFEEEIKTEKIGKKEVSNGEQLRDLRSDLGRFYRLNQKLRSINHSKEAENPAKTVEKLNKMLKANGIGGANWGAESKAYFVTNGKEVVLVANTVAEGKEISSRDAICEAFAKIDKLLADPFSTALAGYDKEMKDISSSYQENTNDAFRVMDAWVNMAGSAARMFGFKGWEGGDKSYERQIDGVKEKARPMAKLFEKYYAERLQAIGPDRIKSKQITKEEQEEIAVLESQKVRFEALSGAKLSSPPWMTVELTKFILTEKKADSAKNLLIMAGWVVWGAGKAVFESAKFVFWDVPKFLGGYAVDGGFRKEVNEAVSAAGEAIAKYSQGKDSRQMFGDFFNLFAEALKKEMAAIQELPPEEQAFRIGEITGNVLLMLAGPKLAKDFLKSSALRIKSNLEAVKKLEGLKKVVSIGKVQTWDDLEDFASTVQKVRGRKDLGGDEIRNVIQKIRMGDPAYDVKMLPKAGGFRETAQALIKNGGYLDEKAMKAIGSNWADKAVDGGKAAYRKTGEVLHKLFPQTFSREITEAGKEFGTLRKVHDVVDDKVTNLRSKLSDYRSLATVENASAWFSDVKVSFAKLTSAFAASGSKDAGLSAAIAAFAEKMPALQRTVDAVSSGAELAKNGVKEVVAVTSARASAVLEAGSSVVESGKEAVRTVEGAIANLRGRLPKHVRNGLSFERGFAIYESSPGKTAFVRPDGTFLTDAKGKAMEFRHASQFSKYGAVVANEEGKFGMIGRDGKFLIEPKYDMIRDLSDERKIVSLNGKYHMIGKDKSGVFAEKLTYDFITEPHQGRAIGVRKAADGSEIRELIQDRKGSRTKELISKTTGTPYELVDDFAEDGIAAARLRERSPSGKVQWEILGKDGRHIGIQDVEGKAKSVIEADNPAEALNRYREWKAELNFTNDFEKMARARGQILKKYPQLAEKSVNIIETNVDGVYRIQTEGPNGLLKGYVNMKHDVFIEPKFQDAFFNDAKDGFIRVKQDGKWGVIDVQTGEFRIDPKKFDYATIQVSNERMGLFEVEVDHLVGNADASIGTARRVGLVGPTGKVLIEPKYTYIENPREGLYRGISHAEGDYSKAIAQSSYFDVANASAADGIGSWAKIAKADPLSVIVNHSLAANDVRTKAHGVDKVIDPFRRTLDSVTVGKFFWSSEELFWKGKLSFSSYLTIHSTGKAMSKARMFEIFEQFAKERANDFVRNFAETEHRILGRLDFMRVRQKFQTDMRSALEGQFMLALAGRNEGEGVLADALRVYLDTKNPANKRPSLFDRTALSAA